MAILPILCICEHPGYVSETFCLLELQWLNTIVQPGHGRLWLPHPQRL